MRLSNTQPGRENLRQSKPHDSTHQDHLHSDAKWSERNFIDDHFTQRESIYKANQSTNEAFKTQFLRGNNEQKIVILRIKALQARIGLGRSAIYYLMDEQHALFDAHFPRSIKLGAHAVGWIESEVEAWLEYRVTASRKEFQVGGVSK